MKSNGNKASCMTCGNLQFGECWLNENQIVIDVSNLVTFPRTAGAKQYKCSAKEVQEASMFFACNFASMIKK